MKKLALLALCLGFAFVLNISAADPKPKTKLTAEEKAARLKKYDKNGDGKLDADEKKAMKEDQQKEKDKAKAAPVTPPAK